MSKWMLAGVSRGAERVDTDKGIVYGVSVCTTGEAQGHGVSLDESFVDSVVRFGNDKRQGLKCRFGHPNACSTSLGTFVGRIKNFRAVDDEHGYRVLGDLFLSASAKEAPGGNLYDYVLNMAQTEPDMFGTSIVFEPGRLYRRDEAGHIVFDASEDFYAAPEPTYVECVALFADDLVDDPAANDGLFSAFAKETPAGQAYELLQSHPEAINDLMADRELMDVLSKYGGPVGEYLARYNTVRAQHENSKQEDSQMSNDQKAEALGAPEVEAPETEPVELESAEAEPETPEAAEPATEPEQLETEPETEQPEAAEVTDNPRAEFARMREDFGDEIAAATFASGGSYNDAQKDHIATLKSENDALRKQLEAKGEEVDAATFSEGKTKPRSLTELANRKNKR